ncbi:hypothetical protein QYE76_029630 [Lolium multiflorum]|uniref:CCHC-type domain-containing protein n=1 Tax=Lolium multiflorum TaxID=4521 RepID=A0AAD8VFQ0_LOLMU|nr:hypothetical protein QYE76_029630 [Lolium multiflorum]
MMQLLQTLLADREDERAERQANIAALQQIANQGHGNHDHPGSKLKNFQNTNPPVFSKTEEPLDADDWLQTMENNLEVAGVEENEKVRPDETDTTEKRKERFLNGLHDEMQTVLVNIPFADLEALVDSAIQMEGKLHQANENRKRRMMNQSGPSNTPRFRPSSSGGFNPRNTKPQNQMSRPGFQNRSGGNPRPGGPHHNNNTAMCTTTTTAQRAPANNNPNNSNTAPRTGSNAIPVTPKDKATITCYECGIVGHYSNECPKRLAKLAGNTFAPAQQQRRVSTGKKFAPNNSNNRGGRLYHMNAEEAQEAPDVVLATKRFEMAPFEALYGRKLPYPSELVGSRRKPSLWTGCSSLEEVHKIREYLKVRMIKTERATARETRDDIRDWNFVYLKVSPLKECERFQLKGKLAPCRTLQVLSRRRSILSVELPEEMAAVHNVFHISLLRKCLEVPEKTEVFKNIDHRSVDINSDLTYREVPIRILEEAYRTTRTRSIKFLKIQWSNHTEEEATWEREEDMKKEYPDLFST